MARLGINTGTNPNDGTGDALRVAMGKINSNFQEIYNTIGNGTSLASYVSSAGIATLAQNLTGNPIINISGSLNTGITTTEHIQVRNITSTGVVTATQFVGDGSQLTNVTAVVGGLEVLDNSVRMGVARELNFGDNITSTGPDGVGRVTISVGNTFFQNTAGYAVTAGIATYSTSAEVATYTPYAITAGVSTYSLTAGLTTSATYATSAGIATTSISVVGGIASVSALRVSGVSTFSGNINYVIGLSGPQANFTGIVTVGGSLRVGINTSAGVILTSPNGTKYQLFVQDDGTIKTIAV